MPCIEWHTLSLGFVAETTELKAHASSGHYLYLGSESGPSVSHSMLSPFLSV